MIVCKVIFLFGVYYLVVGIANVRTHWVDVLYRKLWGAEPPTSIEIIIFGCNLIVSSEILAIILQNI